jgi:hypothetical protein
MLERTLGKITNILGDGGAAGERSATATAPAV